MKKQTSKFEDFINGRKKAEKTEVKEKTVKYPPIPDTLFYAIIIALENQTTMSRKVDEGIGAINSSYTVLDLDKYTREVLQKVVSATHGAEVWDWIEWWLYETNSKGGKCMIKDKKYNVNTPEKLYNFMYKKP